MATKRRKRPRDPIGLRAKLGERDLSLTEAQALTASEAMAMRRRRGHSTEDQLDIDRHVGSRLRMRRTILGMNQSQLGNAAGITFQQVQKYENGANRVSASKLFQFASVLGVPVSFFFEGAERKPRRERRAADQETKSLHKRETLEFVRALTRISNFAVRKSLADLIFTVAGRNNN